MFLHRDIYYIDPAYFKSQHVVDKIVDDLAYTIGVDRAALNIVSSSWACEIQAGICSHSIGSSGERTGDWIIYFET